MATYGVRCWDVNGNIIVDITTALSNILGVITVPKNLTGTTSGTIANPLPQNSRFFYYVCGNNVPLNALAWAGQGERRVNVVAFKLSLSIDQNGIVNWSATNQWGQDLGLNNDVLIYVGCY